MVILFIIGITFIILLSYGAGLKKCSNSEKILIKEIQELKTDNIALKRELCELVYHPDSVKSTMIKSAVRLGVEIEKMIWK